MSTTAEAHKEPGWADPGYFRGRSRIVNGLRLLLQLIRPPRGHRTLPTTAGVFLILITIGVGSAAFNTGQNILYLALALLLSTLLLSGVMSWNNFKGCRWRMDSGERFRVGEITPINLVLLNTKKQLPSWSLSFLVSAQKSGQREVIDLLERLDAGEEKTLEWAFAAQKRGRERLVLEALLSRYPFGFLKKSIQTELSHEVVIWPGRVRYEFSAGRIGQRWQAGMQRQRGEGVDLIQLRDYRQGDSWRKLHWKATARLGKLQIRETEQERHAGYRLWIDPSKNLWVNEAQFEQMLAFAGTLAEDLYRSDQLRSGQIAGGGVIVTEDTSGLVALMDALATVEYGESQKGLRQTRGMDVIWFEAGDNAVIARSEGGVHGRT
jgi:uncharacterized protein (DUF58 family)